MCSLKLIINLLICFDIISKNVIDLFIFYNLKKNRTLVLSEGFFYVNHIFATIKTSQYCVNLQKYKKMFGCTTAHGSPIFSYFSTWSLITRKEKFKIKKQQKKGRELLFITVNSVVSWWHAQLRARGQGSNPGHGLQNL